MSISWLYRRSERTERPRRRAARLMLEQLEDRQLLSTTAVLNGISTSPTYAGVGFHLNPVATLNVIVNGVLVNNTKSSYSAQIDWGDSTSGTPDITPGYLADGIDAVGAISPSFYVKGTHTYDDPGNYSVHIYVTGPNGSTNDMTTATSITVEPMAQPISTGTPVPTLSPDPPFVYPGVLSQPASVYMNINSTGPLYASTGVMMPTSNVGTVAGYLNEQLDLNPSNYEVQINWGDSGAWSPDGQASGDSQVVDTGSTQFLTLVGSHTYTQPGQFPVHFIVTGPDGTTADMFSNWVIVDQRPNELSATPPPGGDVFSVTTGQELTGAVLVVDVVDPNAVVTGLKGEIHNAADGSTTPAVFVPAGQNTWGVDDTEKFKDPGKNPLFVSVNDAQGDSVTGSDQVVVAQASPSPQPNPQPQPQPTPQPSPPVVNLTSSITTGRVVPTQAPDLNLYQFFGNEEVNVPIVVTNTGTAATKVSVKVQLFLSGAPPLAGQAALFGGSKTMTLSLAGGGASGASGASATIPVNNVVVPTSLIAGDPYYITAQVSYTDLTGANAKYPNSTATSGRTFEFLGTPTNTPKKPYANLFETSQKNPKAGKTYFNIVRDTLNGNSALRKKTGEADTDLNDAKTFIQAFEGDYQYAYLDTSKGRVPTIGVGINLNTISGALLTKLASRVKTYYGIHYTVKGPNNTRVNPIAQYTPAKVKSLLISQAKANARKPVLTPADDQALFDSAYAPRAAAAQGDPSLAGVWDQLTTRQQITPIDQLYNSGAIFQEMASAMGVLDFARAGFDVVDSKNVENAVVTNPRGLSGLLLRMEAEYQNLFTNPASLGTILKNP